MFTDWLGDILQTIFASLFYEFLVGVAVCILVRWLQKRNEGWFRAVFYGTVAFGLVLALGIAVTRKVPQLW